MRTADVEDLYELAPLQQGILFHCLAAQDPGLYLVTLSYGLRGPLEPDLFLRAWQAVVDRHPVLRTSFHWRDLEKPLQLVHREARLSAETLDWSPLPPDEQETRLRALLEAERRREFRLERAPLMRLSLVRLGAERHRLVWVFHHIVMEGWSASLVLHEAFALYEGWRRGEPAELPSHRPYRDHVLWLQQRDAGRAEGYWRRSLRGFSAPTPLPLARRASAADGGAGYGRQALVLSAPASASLGSLARRHHLTMSTLLQGAWAILLARHAGEEDVLFGGVVSGRQEGLPEAESMVGLFVNTLPARVTVPRSAGVMPWLQSLQGQLAEMREFEWSPLPQVQGWSEVPRGTPLFQTIFAFENWLGDIALRQGRGELAVEDVRPVEGGVGYPLLLEASAASRVSVSFTYSRRHYEEEAVARLMAQYGRLLEGIATRPEATLAELSLLDEDERTRLVTSWNETARAYPDGVTVPQLLERQARETPERVAVTFGSESLTYAELGRRSRQVAHHLRALGVAPEDRVGLCCESSLDLAIGLLGILKAGGAWVPLDPSHPAERLSYVLADSGVRVVLTRRSERDRLPPSAVRTVSLDEDWPAISRQSPDGPDRAPDVASLAYVIYTSGSTGRPKGVQVPHRAVANLLWAMRREPGLGPEDVLLSVTTSTFDIFVLELLLPLVVGGRVVLASRAVASDGEALARELERSGATVMQSTPATWRMLLEAGWTGASGLRAWCGGEAMPPELVRELRARCASLWNLYGPTETTVYATGHRVEAVEESIPIGRPIANTRAYVLDDAGRPAPIGVPGELCVGGDGVARGYLDRPDLTAARFSPDPFAGIPGARLYRTGDRARWRPDGRLEFLGRLDDQVKVRGFRIEPGEIEAVLGGHPEIREGAVIARPGPGGASRLVGYAVARNGRPPTTDALRAFLASRLPAYMVPSVFVTLPALPRTSSGKVDRRALPAPGDERPELSSRFLAPRSAVEDVVSGIWREALGLERVGVRDNFFDLGGHSLLLVRVHGRLRERFPDRELTVVDLFRHATVADIARHLGDSPGETENREPTEALSDRLRAGRARLALRREARESRGDEGRQGR